MRDRTPAMHMSMLRQYLLLESSDNWGGGVGKSGKLGGS